MAVSPFGNLPHVPFLSLLEMKGVDSEDFKKENTFVLKNDQLSIETVTETLEGETDLPKIVVFVRQHFNQLPKQSQFLIPKQVNFLIDEHNAKAGSEWIDELPGSEGDFTYQTVLVRLHDLVAKFAMGDQKKVDDFFAQFDKNLALSPQIEEAVHDTIESSSFDEEQKRSLNEALESSLEYTARKTGQFINQVIVPQLEIYYALVFAIPIERK